MQSYPAPKKILISQYFALKNNYQKRNYFNYLITLHLITMQNQQKSMAYYQNNQPVKIDPEMTHIVELGNKYIKTVIKIV